MPPVAILNPVRPRALPRCTAFVAVQLQLQHTARSRRSFATSTILFSASATRPKSKVYASADEAVLDIKSGSTILSSGFGLCGVAGELLLLTNLPTKC